MLEPLLRGKEESKVLFVFLPKNNFYKNLNQVRFSGTILKKRLEFGVARTNSEMLLTELTGRKVQRDFIFTLIAK